MKAGARPRLFCVRSLAVGDPDERGQQPADGHVELSHLLQHRREVLLDRCAVAGRFTSRIVEPWIDRIGMAEGPSTFRQHVEKGAGPVGAVGRVHEITSGVLDTLQRRDKTIDFHGSLLGRVRDAVVDADAVTRLRGAQARPVQPKRSSGTAAAASSTAAMRVRVKGSFNQKTAMSTAKIALVSRRAAAGAIGAWLQTHRMSR